MPTSYRDIIAPAFGVGIAGAVLAWALYPEEPKLTGNIARQEQQPGYRAGGPDCLPSEIANLRGRKRARRTVTCQEAEEQYRLAANDLVQQRRAADAADASAVLTYQQTRIAAWGVFLGFVTMAAAIAAAWFARRAAVATEETVGLARDSVEGADTALAIAERNAVAAARQVEVNIDTSQRRLRAYFHVTWVRVSDIRGFPLNIHMLCRNHGLTPATNIVHTSNWHLSFQGKFVIGHGPIIGSDSNAPLRLMEYILLIFQYLELDQLVEIRSWMLFFLVCLQVKVN